MSWQPIATAPKDSRRVLVWLVHRATLGSIRSAVSLVYVGWWSEREGRWITYDEFGLDLIGRGEVTHWMPLPAGPGVNEIPEAFRLNHLEDEEAL